jgi:glutamate-1-semialdehyde 2,1-aminomutase
VFTADRADSFHQESEIMRQTLGAVVESKAVPLQFCGEGSLFTMHLASQALQQARDVSPLSRQVGLLFHMYGLLNGVAIAGRGDFYQSLPMGIAHREQAIQVVSAFVSEFRGLISDLAEENVGSFNH